jgi:hypothetical protein
MINLKDNISDEQAQGDLLLLYRDIDTSNDEKRKFFWSVLECVGCEEEFKSYLAENPEEEEKIKRVTVWYAQNKDGSWSHNHIENGWVTDFDHPHSSINDRAQEAAWANKKWNAVYAWMTKDGLVSEKAALYTQLWLAIHGSNIIPTEDKIKLLEGKQ